jgi:hypothetical protein
VDKGKSLTLIIIIIIIIIIEEEEEEEEEMYQYAASIALRQITNTAQIILNMQTKLSKRRKNVRI